MSGTCKSGVEWLVQEYNGAYIYVCDEHLTPAVKGYSGEVIVRKVVGCSSCFWKDVRGPSAHQHELREIIEQLEKCDFECIAGPLRLNTAFIKLKEIADATE